MPLGITAFQNYLAQAQKANQLSAAVASIEKVNGEPGELSLCSRTIKNVDSTLSNNELRQSLMNALSPNAKGDQQILGEIHDLLLGDEQANADLTGLDIYTAFRLLEDRKVSQLAAQSLVQGGLLLKLEADLADAQLAGEGESVKLELELEKLEDAVQGFRESHSEQDPIWGTLELNRSDDVVGGLKAAFKLVQDLMVKENCKGGLSAHLEDANGKMGLRSAIRILSGASGLLGEVLCGEKVTDETQKTRIAIIQENAELYALRLERIIDDLTELKQLEDFSLKNAITAEFGAKRMNQKTEADLAKAFEDISRDLSQLEHFEALESEKKESGLTQAFVSGLRTKVGNLIKCLKAIPPKERVDTERLRELEYFVVGTLETLKKYEHGLSALKTEGMNGASYVRDGKTVGFDSATAVKDAFLSRLDVDAYVELRKTYPQEMIDFFVSDVSTYLIKNLGQGSFNSTMVNGVLSGDGKMVQYVTKSRNADNRGVHRSPYSAAGIYGSLDMVRNNYASWKAGKVVLGTQANVKSKVSVVGERQNDYSILMEMGQGKDLKKVIKDLQPTGKKKIKDEFKLIDVLCNRQSADYWRCIGTMLRSSNELDWTDWLTAQGDRHNGNIMFHKSVDHVMTFKGIDNDLCFPTDRPTMGKLRLDRSVLRELRLTAPQKEFPRLNGRTIEVTRVFTPIKNGHVVENYNEKTSDVDYFELDLSIPPKKKLTEDEIQLLNLKAYIVGLNSVRRPNFITSGQLARLKARQDELREWKYIAGNLEGKALKIAVEEFAKDRPNSICAAFKDVFLDPRQLKCMYSRTEEMLAHALELEKENLVLNENWLTEDEFENAAKDVEDHPLSQFFERVRTRMYAELKRLSPKRNLSQVRRFLDSSFRLMDFETRVRELSED